MSQHDDFHAEPVPGLPAKLPKGENILWQGKPDTGLLARGALHMRKIAIYFVLLGLWRVIAGISDGKAVSQTITSVMGTLVLGAVALAIIWVIARAMHKTTIYTITNRRVVMRFGVAIPITFQLPFSQIAAADVKPMSGNHGTIALTLKEHTKISWPILWPHVRPWKLAQPQPSLRAIGEIDKVAKLLGDQLRAAHGISEPTPVLRTIPGAPPKGQAPLTEMNLEAARRA